MLRIDCYKKCLIDYTFDSFPTYDQMWYDIPESQIYSMENNEDKNDKHTIIILFLRERERKFIQENVA